MAFESSELHTTWLRLPEGFPVDDLEVVGQQLTDAGICIPGYLPPEMGLLSTAALCYEHAHGVQMVLLPDRNVVSRMAQLAAGETVVGNEQRRLAAALLGLCQCHDIEIEPGAAFHELAHREGNDVALNELRLFRLADSAHAQETLDVALGRSPTLRLRPVDLPGPPDGDLSRPLRRWNRNYVIALRILELEAKPLTPLQRVKELMDWMVSDFTFGAPGALLAMVFLAPNSPPKKDVFKNRHSTDREAAIRGVRNAAWDLTQLSDFTAKVNAEGEEGQTRYLFATFDKHLRLQANLIFQYGTDLDSLSGLADALSAWWPRNDAIALSDALRRHLERVHAPGWRREVSLTYERVMELIRDGEERVRRAVGRPD
ncbi:hypothetical protein [Roseateles depolymerans]|uniref:Uncharacterized protein n=1 Tax=Roseateles depolymerans TaxID=76731 RepID=A0A0U3MGB2_9BURK|nr:hypothetical protein [Roseateles depolymerans]ALV07725.1 hypothetical protein RD2015_3267 [Roseateles depolymerans]REG22051.1 hypothetical protein DES44_1193 [Roseateles depolymerans]